MAERDARVNPLVILKTLTKIFFCKRGLKCSKMYVCNKFFLYCYYDKIFY